MGMSMDYLQYLLIHELYPTVKGQAACGRRLKELAHGFHGPIDMKQILRGRWGSPLPVRIRGEAVDSDGGIIIVASYEPIPYY